VPAQRSSTLWYFRSETCFPDTSLARLKKLRVLTFFLDFFLLRVRKWAQTALIWSTCLPHCVCGCLAGLINLCWKGKEYLGLLNPLKGIPIHMRLKPLAVYIVQTRWKTRRKTYHCVFRFVVIGRRLDCFQTHAVQRNCSIYVKCMKFFA